MVFRHALLFLFFLFPFLHLNGKEHGSWIDTDNKNNVISIEWYTYDQVDDTILEQLFLTIPVYAAAMAELQVDQIHAFRKLPEDKQRKIPKYQQYPEDFSLSSSQPYLEASLLLEFQEELLNASQNSFPTENYLILVKETDGTLLGFTHFSLQQEEQNAELEPIMILPEAQGRGLARKLLFSILTLRQNINRISLCTNAKNLKMQAVCKHLRFKERSRIEMHDIHWEYGTGIIFEYLVNTN